VQTETTIIKQQSAYEENDNKKRVVLYNRKKGERSAVTEHTAESPKNDD
jgi:hypothetical protein